MNTLYGLDIQYIKGIGPKRADLIRKSLGVNNAHDLIRHFPLHYVDRSRLYTIREMHGEMPAVQIKGHFLNFQILGEGPKRRLEGLFSDGQGTVKVLWFQSISAIQKAYHTGAEYIIFGKPQWNDRWAEWSMAHPEVDTPGAPGTQAGFKAIYSVPEPLKRAGITSRTISGWMRAIIEARPQLHDPLPRDIREGLNLMPLREALIKVHNPTDATSLNNARLRLKFDELFLIQVEMERHARQRRNLSVGQRFTTIGRWFNGFYNECLPFALTDAQKRVLREIRADVNTGRQMNRLVQGDVGSGKTIVALMAMLMALDNGCQACLMAPTEILATQHYETLRELVAPIGINVALLTGSTRTKVRRSIHRDLADGTLQILVGTHALVEDTVQFNNLGLAVIDEQHRFGVAQRAKLWAKNIIPPHVLVMTATPIPRTLAMTVYGDLDVSVIDQLPPGRKPIVTSMCYDTSRHKVMQAVGRQLRAGRQVYIVYPLIEENAKLDLLSLQEGYEFIKETFGACYEIAFVHGRMKPAEKDRQMEMFASGKARILVATTVIEVGVNVPNATTMVIENAERFGLSQLHQLRGRVGRGGDQSYCVLMTRANVGADTRKRLELMTRTTDGFEIAEADMAWRGPGDIEGTMQSGLPFDLKIADLAKDGQIIQMARDAAQSLVEADPDLTLPGNLALAKAIQLAQPETRDWSRIS